MTDRTPYCHKVRYGITGAPILTDDEMDGSHAPGVGIAPALIELVYSAPRDGKPPSVSASVTGAWTRFGRREDDSKDDQVTTHFKNGPDGWPEWLAAEARLHDPDTAATPSVPADADLRTLIRGVIRDCPAEFPDDIADRVWAALQSAYRRLLTRLEADRAGHLRAAGRAKEAGGAELLLVSDTFAAAMAVRAFEGPDAAQAYMQRTEGGQAGQDPAVLPAPADQAADGLAATTCSAQYRGDEDGARLCIRAAQHTGKAHTDEHGIHWSDTVAEYPIADGAFRVGTNVPAELRRMADEAQQAEQECSSSISGSCLSLFESDVPCDTSAGECVHGGKPAVEARQADTAEEGR